MLINFKPAKHFKITKLSSFFLRKFPSFIFNKLYLKSLSNLNFIPQFAFNLLIKIMRRIIIKEIFKYFLPLIFSCLEFLTQIYPITVIVNIFRLLPINTLINFFSNIFIKFIAKGKAGLSLVGRVIGFNYPFQYFFGFNPFRTSGEIVGPEPVTPDSYGKWRNERFRMNHGEWPIPPRSIGYRTTNIKLSPAQEFAKFQVEYPNYFPWGKRDESIIKKIFSNNFFNLNIEDLDFMGLRPSYKDRVIEDILYNARISLYEGELIYYDDLSHNNSDWLLQRISHREDSLEGEIIYAKAINSYDNLIRSKPGLIFYKKGFLIKLNTLINDIIFDNKNIIPIEGWDRKNF